MKALRSSAVLALLLLALSGCSFHPFIPRSALQPTAHPSRPSLLPPIRPGHPVLGVDLYVGSDYPMHTIRVDGLRDLSYIRHSLHAQSVGIVWNLFSPGWHSETVRSTNITLHPAGIAVLTREAQSLGMAVVYRPIIRVGPEWRWEGKITPPDERAWFTSLFRAELPYLQIAWRLRIKRFIVGTELWRLNNSPAWPYFLDQVHKVYHGVISVAQYQSNYLAKRLLPISEYGIDPYPSFSLPDQASQARVTAAWEHWFAAVPSAIRERTALDEVGFIAQDGAYSQPQRWIYRAPTNHAMQAKWFTAACQTVEHYHMRGVWFYDMNLTDDPAHPSRFPAYFVRNLGSQAIRGCLRLFQKRNFLRR